MEKYLRKGSQTYFEGKLTTRKWQDKDGNDRYTTEIVAHTMKMLGSKPEIEQRDFGAKQADRPAPQQKISDGVPFDDEIPFYEAP